MKKKPSRLLRYLKASWIRNGTLIPYKLDNFCRLIALTMSLSLPAIATKSVGVCLVFGLGFSACSPDLPEPTSDFYSKQGWSQYKNGQYDDAKSSFELAQQLNQDSAEASLGLGWLAFVESADLQTAKEQLENALLLADQDGNQDLLNDARAGLAGINLSLELYQDAIKYGEQIEDGYRFTRGKPNFGYRELTLLLAISYFHLGNYEESVEKIQQLNPKFSWQPEDSPSKILKELEKRS